MATYPIFINNKIPEYFFFKNQNWIKNIGNHIRNKLKEINFNKL